MNFSAGLRSFYKPCPKKFGFNIWVHTDSTIRIYLWVQNCKLQEPATMI